MIVTKPHHSHASNTGLKAGEIARIVIALLFVIRVTLFFVIKIRINHNKQSEIDRLEE